MTIVEQILQAHKAGANTRKEIALLTALDPSVVDATIDILTRTGQIDVHALKVGCGIGGCGGCVEDEKCAPNPSLMQIGIKRAL